MAARYSTWRPARSTLGPGSHGERILVRAIAETPLLSHTVDMLYAASLCIALAAILITQVAHRRARGRASQGRWWENSPYVMFAPVALVVFGILLVLAVGVSKVIAMAFFMAAFFLALFWTVRTAPKR